MIGPIEEVLAALQAADVRYLVVGGVAVVLHGHLRTTADLDLWVELEPDNIRRAIAAIGALGYRPRAPVEADALTDPKTGRPRDVEDVAALRALAARRENPHE